MTEKTIIVGRGRRKATQRIEINDPMVSREHCTLSDNGDGTYTLQNKSPQGTFVDGRQIVRTQVKADTVIKLSESTSVKVADLLPLKPTSESANSLSQQPSATVPAYSLLPLQEVWDEYHAKLLGIKHNQRKLGLLRSASPMFTLGSGAIATLAKTMGWADGIFGLTIVLTAIGMLLMVYSFIRGIKDKSIEETEKATEEFQSKYVCPNPDCRRFMGNQPYNLVRQNKNCPWCKCKYTE